eukprot:30294-Pelagococcus_subviridis.AAC.55
MSRTSDIRSSTSASLPSFAAKSDRRWYSVPTSAAKLRTYCARGTRRGREESASTQRGKKIRLESSKTGSDLAGFLALLTS